MPDIENLNFYEILEISCDATQEEIKNAFRKQAKKYHPDINHDFNAIAIMQKINEAYETLSNLEKRKAYDLKIISTNGNYQNGRAYKSYTKSQEESEEDLDDFLKIYLLKRRNLDKLYKLYINKKATNMMLKYAFMNPNLKDIAEEKALFLQIEDALNNLLNEHDNPIFVLEYLFNELIKVVLQVTSYQQAYIKNFKTEIKLILIQTEIKKYIEKYINSEYKNDIIEYLLSIMYKVNTEDYYFSLYKQTHNYVKEFIQILLKNVLNKGDSKSKM